MLLECDYKKNLAGKSPAHRIKRLVKRNILKSIKAFHAKRAELEVLEYNLRSSQELFITIFL